MAYCTNCGQEINENAPVCVNCGAAQTQDYSQPQEYAPEIQQEVIPEEDNGGFLWGLLGCCVPVVGLILFLIWKDTKPKTAKAAGIGALVSAICSVLFFVLYFVLIIALGVGMGIMGM